MADLWHYSHAGKTHGPVSLIKLEQLATIGELYAADPVWRDGEDARRSMEAISVVNVEAFGRVQAEVEEGLTAQPPAVQSTPDWLTDVATEPVAPPQPAPHQAPGGKPAPLKGGLPAKPKGPKPARIVLANPDTQGVEAEEEEEPRGFELSRRELIMFGAGVGVVAFALGFAFLLARFVFGKKTEPTPPPGDKEPDEPKKVEDPPAPTDPN
jgi:uncharacterized membrane protein